MFLPNAWPVCCRYRPRYSGPAVRCQSPFFASFPAAHPHSGFFIFPQMTKESPIHHLAPFCVLFRSISLFISFQSSEDCQLRCFAQTSPIDEEHVPIERSPRCRCQSPKDLMDEARGPGISRPPYLLHPKLTCHLWVTPIRAQCNKNCKAEQPKRLHHSSLHTMTHPP